MSKTFTPGTLIKDFEATVPTVGVMIMLTISGAVSEIKFQPYDQLTVFEEHLWPIGVAAFDPTEWVVYITPVLSHDASHGQLVQFYDLESTAEDERLTGEIIYGFITASGHFLNRLEAAKWLQNKFPELIKKPIEYERLISSNVDWVKVIKRSSYLLGR